MSRWGPSPRAVVGRALGRGRTRVPQLAPPGAFYSPIIDTGIVLAEPDRSRIWPTEPADPPGIDMRADAQLALLRQLAQHPRPDAVDRRDDLPAYDPANDQFPPHDAAVLHAMVCHLRPARVVEVGSGWSTTVTARAIRDAGLAAELTCIEPYPRDFLADLPEVELRREKVEHTPPSVFDALSAGDILFIDSSHVAKTGSDVVHLVLEVLPRLAEGVVVHVHDVFMPADYPTGWVEVGFGWNEQYLIQAYLSGNARTQVLLMNQWLARRHPDAVTRAFGQIELDGSSIWFTTTFAS